MSLRIFHSFGVIIFAAARLLPAAPGDDAADTMLAAYGNLDYAQACRLAEKMPENPKARLVLALARLFGRETQDLKGGLAALGALYRNRSLPQDVWAQAALSYGRTAQLIQERKELYGDLADEVTPREVFQEIIARVPNSRAACVALLFELTGDLDSPAAATADATFAKLEKFCRDFRGSPEYLVPLHLFADQKYLVAKKDFRAAAGHLAEAHRLGIANPRDAEIALYRLGRMYDLKLQDPATAAKYYREFLARYSESGYAASVSRFLSQLGGPPAGGERHATK